MRRPPGQQQNVTTPPPFPPNVRVAIVINTSWNIWNFRASLVRALQAAGHEVLAIAPPDDYSQRLETELGCRYVPILMQNKGTNPVQDALLTHRFFRIYQRERPDVVLHYTIKPNIYGTLAAPPGWHPQHQQRQRLRHGLYYSQPGEPHCAGPVPGRVPVSAQGVFSE